MNCQTKIGNNFRDARVVCGHSITSHAGDESGISGIAPCMMPECPCEDFTAPTPKQQEIAKAKMADRAVAMHTIAAQEAGGVEEATRKTAEGVKNISVRPLACPTCGSAVPALRGIGPCEDPWHVEQEVQEAERDNPTTMGKTVQKWADQAMFTAEPIDATQGPRVYLLSMTPDPLAAIAAACKMYKGEVARSYRDVSHAERQEFVRQVLKTKLQAPFEFVKFHFMIEGVTRAFTHQMVRQRTAVYAQESLRFAVKQGGVRSEGDPVAVPPYLAGTVSLTEWASQMSEEDGSPRSAAYIDRNTSDLQRLRNEWDSEVGRTMNVYGNMIDQGMPAEDARGLLPHNTLTRLHYSTDLRALLDHAGNRLCTQAQFEWRLVFARIAEAIRRYNPYEGLRRGLTNIGEYDAINAVDYVGASDSWQYDLLADLFRPVCYATGKCEFMAEFDRACNIRDRVQANHAIGRDSSKWAEEHDAVRGNPIVSGVGPQSVVRDEANQPVFIGAIQHAEWLLNPDAARRSH